MAGAADSKNFESNRNRPIRIRIEASQVPNNISNKQEKTIVWYIIYNTQETRYNAEPLYKRQNMYRGDLSPF